MNKKGQCLIVFLLLLAVGGIYMKFFRSNRGSVAHFSELPLYADHMENIPIADRNIEYFANRTWNSLYLKFPGDKEDFEKFASHFNCGARVTYNNWTPDKDSQLEGTGLFPDVSKVTLTRAPLVGRKMMTVIFEASDKSNVYVWISS